MTNSRGRSYALTRDEMTAMRKAGFTIRHIADQAGTSRSALGYWFRSRGIEPETKVIYWKLPESLGPELDRLYWGQKLSLREIAERYQVSPGRVLSWMCSFGIPRRSRSEAIRLSLRKHPEMANRDPVPQEAHEGYQRWVAEKRLLRALNSCD